MLDVVVDGDSMAAAVLGTGWLGWGWWVVTTVGWMYVEGRVEMRRREGWGAVAGLLGTAKVYIDLLVAAMGGGAWRLSLLSLLSLMVRRVVG
jgi:hypothetical protein